MEIARLTLRHIRIPLKKEIRHASHARTETDSLLVRCELRDGAVGWGEGLPREYVTGEDIDAAWELLQRPELPGTLTGRGTFREWLDRLADWQLPGRPTNQRECFGHSARCAVELAILDALCRSQNQPLSAVVGQQAGTEPIQQSVDEVRYSAAITSEHPRKQMLQAFKLKLFGFAQVKVKVGVAGIDDARILKWSRRILGRRVDLRIDANEAWRCEDLADRLKPLERFHITAVEQPVPHEHVAGLAAVKPQLSVPIMLDESLCGFDDGERAIQEGYCDLFNIRLSKCGGFLPALKLAVLANQAGLGYQLGCQVGETGVLSAAGRHFASAVKHIRYLEGSYDRFLVHEPLTTQDLTFGYGGKAPAISRPGLGIDVDEQAVERVTRRQSELEFLLD